MGEVEYKAILSYADFETSMGYMIKGLRPSLSKLPQVMTKLKKFDCFFPFNQAGHLRRGRWMCEFEVSLLYVVSSRTARAA